MLARSNSRILSLYVDQFDYRPMPRSKEPEIFTFDDLPAQVSRYTSLRHRRKNTRVMYPAKVRKYFPPAEKSPAKRWLLILCVVVFLQIYTEEPCVETPSPNAVESPAADVASADLSFPQYQLLPFQSAEQQVRQMRSLSAESPQKEQEPPQKEKEPEQSLIQLLKRTCPCRGSEVTALYDKSRSTGYVVALLFPVCHRLGSEK